MHMHAVAISSVQQPIFRLS